MNKMPHTTKSVLLESACQTLALFQIPDNSDKHHSQRGSRHHLRPPRKAVPSWTVEPITNHLQSFLGRRIPTPKNKTLRPFW